MDDLVKYVESWHSLVFVIVVFGFAPGFCLRLIVLAYPRNDPRRAELIAELYAVPRAKRPLWVAEQLEVALFEGLAHRVSAVIRRLTARRRDQETHFITRVETEFHIPPSLAVTSYRCPGCDHEIRVGMAHVVVSSGDRRHWHSGCWAARRRRMPT